MKTLMALLTGFVATFMFGSHAEACTCEAPDSPCQAYNSAAAVFLGVATSVSIIAVPTRAPGQFTTGVVARIRIETSFKSDVSGTVSVYTGSAEGGDCGFPLLQNE